MHENDLRKLVKTQIDWPRLRVADSVGWDEAQECAFLTNAQVRLMLPTGGPCFGNHCSRPSPFRTGILSLLTEQIVLYNYTVPDTKSLLGMYLLF